MRGAKGVNFRRTRTAVLSRSVLLLALMLIGLGLPGAVHGRGLSVDAFIEKWDEDHDGTLSLDEVKKAASAQFDELDRKHRGKLTRAELGGVLNFQEFRRADADKDRTLDRDEFLSFVEKLFQAADTDHDGKLDKKKLSSRPGRYLLRLFRARQGPLM
jgi:Ca2+-binding EF-hand superfamily protein